MEGCSRPRAGTPCSTLTAATATAMKASNGSRDPAVALQRAMSRADHPGSAHDPLLDDQRDAVRVIEQAATCATPGVIVVPKMGALIDCRAWPVDYCPAAKRRRNRPARSFQKSCMKTLAASIRQPSNTATRFLLYAGADGGVMYHNDIARASTAPFPCDAGRGEAST